MEKSTLHFIDNKAIKGREDKFTTVTVAIIPILASWKESLFAHEWVTKEGLPKPVDQLSENAREKKALIEKFLAGGVAIERPVLGLGILDNLEIGTGKDVIVTLAANNYGMVSVHIPTSHMNDFKLFIKG